MRKVGKICCYILLSFITISCKQKESTPVVQIKKLDYPSASAVEYYNGRLYVMGDDATDLLVLDTNLNVIDSIQIIAYDGKRIPKDIKPDLEASAIINTDNGKAILLIGSGSLSPSREMGWLYNLETKKKDSFSLHTKYSAIKEQGIEQLNIEGACFINESLILANRGNKSYPKNHLIITNETFWRQDSTLQTTIVLLENKNDTSLFHGISGMCYAKQNEQLIMTVSTEDTKSSYEDGTIGKSYLWIIDLNSNKKIGDGLSIDRVIDLEAIDPGFKGQKIESAAVIEETKDFIRLVLVADNDDGSSMIFKVSMKRD